MSITTNYSIKPVITGDFKFSQLFDAPPTVDSFSEIREYELNLSKDITTPAASRALLIVPPAGNTNSLNVKISTDTTGINLNPNAPSIISLANSQQIIRITAGDVTTILVGIL